MAQHGAMTRHDVGFSMLDDGRLIGVSDPGCNATSCGGSRVGCLLQFRRRHACHYKLLRLCYPYGVPPGLGVGGGLLLNAGCGVPTDEEPHPVKPLPAF
jgi:hypothetical protein